MEIKKKLKKNIFQLKSKAKCPTCKKKQKEPFVPFCSKKCAELDLMKWLLDEHQMHMKNN